MKLTKKVKPRQKILLLNGKAGRQEKFISRIIQ